MKNVLLSVAGLCFLAAAVVARSHAKADEGVVALKKELESLKAQVKAYAEAIEEARASNMPTGRPVLHADDFLPEKDWHVLSCIGYMSDDPYSGAPGVEKVGEGVYKVTTLLATRQASSRVTFTFRWPKKATSNTYRIITKKKGSLPAGTSDTFTIRTL